MKLWQRVSEKNRTKGKQAEDEDMGPFGEKIKK